MNLADFADLAPIIRRRANVVLDRDDATPEERDDAELLCILARLFEGKPPEKAFGAPGDWGYDTPIGQMLARIYKPMTK